MKIFITGMAGFLGSHLAKAFDFEGHEVWGCDNFVGGDIENLTLPGKVNALSLRCKNLDLLEQDQLIEYVKRCAPDVIYHCAAYPHEGLSVFAPNQVTTSILPATGSILSAAVAAGVKRFIFCSSMARYGRKYMPPFTEDLEPAPVDPYGWAKVAAEHTVRTICDVHGIEWVIAVPHNIYGPGQCYDDPYRNVVAIMMNRILHDQPPIVYGDGSQTRCFSYIDDVVPVLMKMSEFWSKTKEVVNVGPDRGEISIFSLAQNILRTAGKTISFEKDKIEGIDFVSGRPCEVKHANCSAEKSRDLYGFEQKTDLYTGLLAMWNWIQTMPRRDFNYNRYQLEILSDKTPKVWRERLL